MPPSPNLADHATACRHLFRVKGVLVSAGAAAQGRVPTEYWWGEDLQHLPPRGPPNYNDGLGA